jgi:transposase
VDSAYVSADDLIMAHEQYGIDLVGPARPDQSWQSRAEEAFSAADFAVDWDRRVARCPEGQESTGWFESAQRPGQRSSIRARFRAADCRACASRTRCTRARLGRHGRVLALLPKREYEALAAARAREGTAEGRRLYAQRQGVESTRPKACGP